MVNEKWQEMRYSTEGVRRQDRLLGEEGAIDLLKRGEYGVLSVSCPQNRVYGVPLNYVWDGKQSIYVHCAPEGRKLVCIDNDPRVSFCVVGRTRPIAEKFTTEYESIILDCRAERGLSADERMHALQLLVEKYSPEFREKGQHYAEKSFARTEIVRLTINSWSGKCKTMPQNSTAQ